MAKAKAATIVKAKKKSWYPVSAPREFNSTSLGETYAVSPNAAIGRVIHTNLKLVTENIKDQNVYLTFKIIRDEGGLLGTEIASYYMVPQYIKKLTRRKTSRIDDSFVVETSDGIKVSIKPISITKNKVVHSVASSLRKACRGIIAREAKKKTFSGLIQSVTSYNLQIILKKSLSKIHPIKTFQIKVIKAVGRGSAVKAAPEEEISEKENSEAAEKKIRKKKEKKNFDAADAGQTDEGSFGISSNEESEQFGEEQ